MLFFIGLIKMLILSRVWMKFCIFKEFKNDMCIFLVLKFLLNFGDVVVVFILFLCFNKVSYRYVTVSLFWINDEGKFFLLFLLVVLFDNCLRIEIVFW